MLRIARAMNERIFGLAEAGRLPIPEAEKLSPTCGPSRLWK
jgi:hypothetical protein